MDQKVIAAGLQKQRLFRIREGNKKIITLCKMSAWTPDLGKDWVFLLFDLFQIRSVAGQFSEVSLDIVEFASKPTLYHTEPGPTIPKDLVDNGQVRFSLIRDKEWNKLLFQISELVLCKIDSDGKPDQETDLYFPLFSPNLKELYLSPEGDVKIIKG